MCFSPPPCRRPGGASLGYAGMNSADSSVPGWLFAPLGPLAVRPSYFPKALHCDAFACWKELLGPAHFADLIRPVGQVHAWETDKETEGAALERRLRERQGIPARCSAPMIFATCFRAFRPP